MSSLQRIGYCRIKEAANTTGQDTQLENSGVAVSNYSKK